MDISSVIDSLHPLEIKVLMTLGARQPAVAFKSEDLAVAAELEPSQLSMAVEWLLAKALIEIQAEIVTPVVSLTKIGQEYHQTAAPIERILAAARDAARTGKRLRDWIPPMSAKPWDG